MERLKRFRDLFMMEDFREKDQKFDKRKIDDLLNKIDIK